MVRLSRVATDACPPRLSTQLLLPQSFSGSLAQHLQSVMPLKLAWVPRTLWLNELNTFFLKSWSVEAVETLDVCS